MALLSCSVSVEDGSWTHPMPLAEVQYTEVAVRVICFRAPLGLILCTLSCTLVPALEGVSKVQMCSI